jgi:hypothetical protein
MVAKVCLLTMMLVSFSYAYASGATDSIGTVSARGDMRVDGNTVWGNDTLFNGTAVETSGATATLQLNNGTEVRLAINSHGVIYRDHLVLLQGRSQLRTAGSGFFLEAEGLRVAPGSPNALGVVSLGPEDTVEVASVTGEFRIADDANFSLAHVAPGAAMSFHPQQAEGAPSQQTSATNFLTRQPGLVSQEDGNYYLTTDEGTKYQLVSAKEFKKYVDKKVIVSGFLQAPPLSTQPTEVIVTEIEVNSNNGKGGGTGMSTPNKVLIGAAVAGGGVAAILVATSSSKSSASR